SSPCFPLASGMSSSVRERKRPCTSGPIPTALLLVHDGEPPQVGREDVESTFGAAAPAPACPAAGPAAGGPDCQGDSTDTALSSLPVWHVNSMRQSVTR